MRTYKVRASLYCWCHPESKLAGTCSLSWVTYWSACFSSLYKDRQAQGFYRWWMGIYHWGNFFTAQGVFWYLFHHFTLSFLPFIFIFHLFGSVYMYMCVYIILYYILIYVNSMPMPLDYSTSQRCWLLCTDEGNHKYKWWLTSHYICIYTYTHIYISPHF